MRKILPAKRCPVCKDKFQPSRDWQIYCKAACRRDAQQMSENELHEATKAVLLAWKTMARKKSDMAELDEAIKYLERCLVK